MGDPRRRGGRPLDVDRRWIPQHLAGQLHDRRRHRRGQQQRLAFSRELPEDPPDIRQEAHVEHPIRLVEDQDFEPGQPRVRRPEVVEEPARGRHQHVRAAPECLLLRLHPDAAEDRRARDSHVAGQLAAVLIDLGGKLARGGEDEGPRRTAAAAGQAMKDWQQEGRRLAAAGDSAREQIASGHGWRDGVGLDGRRRAEPHLVQRAQESRVKVKRSEGHGGSFPHRGSAGPVQSSAGDHARPTMRKMAGKRGLGGMEARY